VLAAMSQPHVEPAHRSAEQVEREKAMAEVSDVLLNLEHALNRAKRAHKIVAKSGADPNAELALAATIRDLERIRKRLTQDTYFAGDALRLV
jgi:hypothetical protein